MTDMPNSFALLPKPIRISEQSWPEGTIPLVSIRCTTYNHVNFIRDAIEGFLMQETTFPVEILIHDDASTDGTTEIVREYEKKYTNCISAFYQSVNTYRHPKRNELRHRYSKAFSGKYIAICEGDDYWTDKDKLQLQATYLETNPGVVLTYTDSQPFDDHGLLDVDFGGARRDLTADELRRSPAIFTLTVMHRNVLDMSPPEFSIVAYGDMARWSLLGEFGSGKYLDHIQPSMYRVHNGGVHSSATADKRRVMRLRTFSGQMAYFERVGDVDLAQYYRSKMLTELVWIEGIHIRILQYAKRASVILEPLFVLRRRLKKFFGFRNETERA